MVSLGTNLTQAPTRLFLFFTYLITPNNRLICGLLTDKYQKNKVKPVAVSIVGHHNLMFISTKKSTFVTLALVFSNDVHFLKAASVFTKLCTLSPNGFCQPNAISLLQTLFKITLYTQHLLSDHRRYYILLNIIN